MFDIIRKAAEKVMTRHHNDLNIDEREIAKFPDTPFLHFTRATGTMIVILQSADSLPAKGERIPSLFGHITREQVIKNIETMSAYYTNPYREGCLLAHYFNGTTVRQITVEKAAEIGREHARRLEAALRRERQVQYA